MGCRRGLACSPDPVARFMRFIPKLALLFLVVHVGAMIYTALHSGPPVKARSSSPESVETLPPAVAAEMSNPALIEMRIAGLMAPNNKTKTLHGTDNKTKNQSNLAFLHQRRTTEFVAQDYTVQA